MINRFIWKLEKFVCGGIPRKNIPTKIQNIARSMKTKTNHDIRSDRTNTSPYSDARTSALVQIDNWWTNNRFLTALRCQITQWMILNIRTRQQRRQPGLPLTEFSLLEKQTSRAERRISKCNLHGNIGRTKANSNYTIMCMHTHSSSSQKMISRRCHSSDPPLIIVITTPVLYY